jgi:hypothetical protein
MEKGRAAPGRVTDQYGKWALKRPAPPPPSYYAETIAIILLRIFCIADSERIPASEMKSDSFAVNNLAGRAKLCIWSPPLVKS